MAELTPQQIRTLNAPALPPAPTTAILEVQQTERTAGTQSSGISLAEVKAAPGAIVETAVAYETAATDTTVNVNASDIPITIGDSMWVGSRLLIRRTAAYDGNPVTISPPPGATFEGRASISLYGQYSFVELERISATVFAVRDFSDYYNVGGGVTVVKNKKTMIIKNNSVAITPVASTPTSSAFTFPEAFARTPTVQVTMVTTIPGTTVVAASCSDITTSGCLVWVYRINTTLTGVSVLAVGEWI